MPIYRTPFLSRQGRMLSFTTTLVNEPGIHNPLPLLFGENSYLYLFAECILGLESDGFIPVTLAFVHSWAFAENQMKFVPRFLAQLGMTQGERWARGPFVLFCAVVYWCCFVPWFIGAVLFHSLNNSSIHPKVYYTRHFERQARNLGRSFIGFYTLPQ